jgi:4-hydroxybenzoate polyprenyltransferase
MLAAFLYTAGPRLKRVPVLGSLVQLAIYLPLMVIGMYRELNVMQIEIMAIFSILLLQNQLLRECSERDSDKTDGNVTTVVRFGVGFAEISTAVMGSAASVLLLVLGSSKMKYEILAVGIVLLSFTLYSLAGRGMNEVYSARMLWIVHRFVAVVIGAVVWFNYLL